MSERKLVECILRGDNREIYLFYKTYKNRILLFVKKRINSRGDAEEVCQDIFISALDSLPMFSFKSSLLTWLYAIARHEVIDYYRRKKIKTIVFSRFPVLEKIVSRALGPELAWQEHELKQKIKATFKNLSEGYSQILRLKYTEGFSMVEIAKKLNLTVKAVESRLFRARLAFRKEYAKKVKSESASWWSRA